MATLKLKQIVYKNCPTALKLQPKLESAEIGDPIVVNGTGIKSFPRKANVKFSSNDKRLFLHNVESQAIYRSNPIIMPLDNEDERIFTLVAENCTIEIRYQVEQ
jgi:hypothetical protein